MSPKVYEEREVDILCQMIKNELFSATEKHGAMKSLHEAYGVIQEEFDEFWEQVKVNPKKLEDDEQADRIQNMREELIQMAAMCVRAIMDVV